MSKKFAKIAAVATLCACIFGTVCFTACEGTPGKSAYDIWIEQGNTGTEQDFLDSLKGTPGTPGTAGKSAYQAWLDAGNTGNEQDFLDSLIGEPGTTPEITISDDGYWEIDGVKTAQKAQGETGTRGNTITKGEGAPTSTEGAIENDMYVDTKEWHVYFFEGTEWVDYGSIKGKDGSDPKPTPAGTEIDIQANDEQEINVDLSEGVHIIKADLGATTLTTGRLQAQIGEVVSELVLSETRSAAAGSDHHIYFGFVVVSAETKTIKMMAKTEAVKGSITFEDWSAPTLNVGNEIEVPVNNYALADNLIKINLSDEIKNSTNYKVTINSPCKDAMVQIWLNEDSALAKFIAPTQFGTAQAVTFTTLKDNNNILYLKTIAQGAVVNAVTIKLENA